MKKLANHGDLRTYLLHLAEHKRLTSSISFNNSKDFFNFFFLQRLNISLSVYKIIPVILNLIIQSDINTAITLTPTKYRTSNRYLASKPAEQFDTE